MARTALPVTVVTRAGITPNLVAVDAVNGNSVVNDASTFVQILNGSASSINVTFGISQLLDGIASPGRIVAVAAGATKYCGPFPITVYGASLAVDFSAGTTVTAAAFSVE